MDNFSSSKVLTTMESMLKEAIAAVMETFDPNHQNLKQEIEKSVNVKMSALAHRLSFYFPPSSEIVINNFSYTPAICNADGIMQGDLVVTYCEQEDVAKYGGPGYPGKEIGQLCEHPKGSGNFFKWNHTANKWEDVYGAIDRGDTGQSWHEKLTNNAAFEPWWGNNTSGNYLRSDRKSNGATDLWGDPGVRKHMGTFNQITADVMKSIYRFTLNLKSAIGHYENLADKFGFGDEEDKKIKESETINIKEEDTSTHILTANKYETITDRRINGFISEIKGLANTRRDSSYHVRQANLKGNIRIEITIKKKYE